MRLRTWALLTTASTFLLMVIGAYVVKTGAGLSCPQWPSCVEGDYLPPFHNPPYSDSQILSEWAHRLLAAITGVLTVGLFLSARRHRGRADLWTLSIAALGLLFAQILMGAATVRLGNVPWTVVIHQGLAIAYFGVLVAILTLAWRFPTQATEGSTRRPAQETPPSARRTPLQVLSDYVALTKPRVLDRKSVV